MTTTTKVYETDFTTYSDKKSYSLEVTFNDDTKEVVSWRVLDSKGNEAATNDDSWEENEDLSISDLSEFFESSNLEKKYPDEFRYHSFYRYGHSDTAEGIIWIASKDGGFGYEQFIGVQGYYDSWNGTDWNDRVTYKVEAFTDYRFR